MNFPLGHLTQELQRKPRMAPSDVHQDERNPGARKRKSWEPRQGRITAGGQRLRAQSASNYTELLLGKP